MAEIKTKDPQARLDYGWDWSAWLDTGETITAHTLTATGVIVESSSVIGEKVVAWLTGGTAGTEARALCQITTSAGRIDERTMTIVVRNR